MIPVRQLPFVVSAKFLVALSFGFVAFAMASHAATDSEPQTIVKTETFDHDPGWEAANNRIVSPTADTVRQDFGYSATSFASMTKGEIGGTVWRAVHPAWYAAKISPRTLDDTLSASGTFAITSKGAGGVVFGWFNSHQTEGTSRPVQSLGLQIGTGKNGGVLHVRLHTAQNQSCGVLIPSKEGKKEHGTFHNDGTRYTWKLDYDPAANAGNGRVTITVRSNLPRPEPFEGLPYTIDLPAGYRKQGTVFDRFGMMSLTKPGGQTSVYFGDLSLDGQTPDLSREPGWEAVDNRAVNEKGKGGANDFGFSNTSHAGGAAGEIGGTVWRTGKLWASYADSIGPLSLDNQLEARGKIMLEVGAPDSGMYFGWFKNRTQEASPSQAGSFVGVRIAGPSRVGHYFAPAFTTAKGTDRTAAKGPVLVPGRVYDFTLSYDPSANDGRGALRVTLGSDSATFDFKKGDRAERGEFDRFGLISVHNDGGHAPVRIWFDNLKYTAGTTRVN